MAFCAVALVAGLAGFYLRGCMSASVAFQTRDVAAPHAHQRGNEWPPLSEEQIARWASALAPMHTSIDEMQVYWGSEVDAKKLYRSLQSVGRKAGFKVITAGGAGEPGKIEIVTSRPNPAGPVISKLFQSAGYPAHLTHPNEDWPTPPATPHGNVQIFIGDKL